MRASAVRTEPHCHDVIVIDDYDETREAIMAVLESQGFTVAGAVSGPDALDMFQAGRRPCVVLLDIRMPGMDGWETWERMKAVPDLAATPVVILSADVADDARAKQVGIREFLRKPIDAKPLLAAIDRHCEHTGNPPAR
jgi:CheY-like chemotaxis protein